MAHDIRWGLAGTVAAGIALAGCAHTELPAPATPADLEASIEADLGSLRALNVVEVRGLVMRLPAEATACYGAPCNDADRALWNDERREQASRLSELTDHALTAASHATATPTYGDVSAALESLRALEIVEVGELIRATPANNPECYNTPCAADIEAANTANAHTDAIVVAIAENAR